MNYSFPTRLAELRSEKKWTQQQLGAKLNVSNATVSRYENGSRHPDPETLIKIADIFQVSVDYLLGRVDSSYEFKGTSHGNPLTDLSAAERRSVEDYIAFIKTKKKKEERRNK